MSTPNARPRVASIRIRVASKRRSASIASIGGQLVGERERHALRLRSDDELAALSVHERKLREISRKLQARIGAPRRP
jgi:hypothetical protein